MTNLFTPRRPKLMGVKKKLDRREAIRERKALSAARLERAIEKELVERLKSKAYGDAPLNVNESVWQAILDREKNKHTLGDNQDPTLDVVAEETDEEDEEELEEEDWDEREFVSDISDSEGDLLSDLEEATVSHPIRVTDKTDYTITIGAQDDIILTKDMASRDNGHSKLLGKRKLELSHQKA